MMLGETGEMAHWSLLLSTNLESLSSVRQFYIYNRGDSALITVEGPEEVECLKHRVLSFGNNRNSLLGLGDLALAHVGHPMEVVQLRGERLQQVASSIGFVLVLNTHGRLFAWGWPDAEFALFPKFIESRVPKILDEPRDIGQIACGECFAAALSADRKTVWRVGWDFGRRPRDQLGTWIKMTELCSTEPVLDIKAGYCNLMALDSRHRLWVWGSFAIKSGKASTEDGCRDPATLVTQAEELGLDFQVYQFAPFSISTLVGAHDGKVYQCQIGRTSSGKTISVVEQLFMPEPIRQIVSTGHYTDTAVLLGDSGRRYVLIWRPGSQLPRIVDTSHTSIVDLFALYQTQSTLPGLINLPRHLSDRTHLESLNGFNHPASSNLHLQFDCKTLHLHRETLASRSTHLAELLQTDQWKKCVVRVERGAWYPIYFAFFLHLYTDRLLVEPTWRDELYALALKWQADSLMQRIHKWDQQQAKLHCKT